MTKARVLLVEDDPLQAGTTKAILEKTGYEVLWVQYGIEAIKFVKTHKPDIILLDLILPGMGGYEVCRWLKNDEASRGIPIIMLTVKKEMADKVSGLNIGADDYLPKPYNELELTARIYASLRTKALQDELRQKNTQLEDLLGKVEHMAITDALTGLYNRRRFHTVLNSEFERFRRYNTPLSLLMLDIDYFKKINDKYGHSAGDLVLKEVSNLLLKSKREIDTAARFGGEEFVVILPNTDKLNARVVAERIRQAVSVFSFSGIDGNLTLSIGISGLPDKDLGNTDLLIRCSDAALYLAKKNGRNRIESIDGCNFSSMEE